MTFRNFRPGNYQVLQIPAAKGLINTAITPQRLSANWARDIENMIPTQGKKLSKRRGCRLNAMTGLTAGHKIYHHDYYLASNGTVELLAFTDQGSIFKTANYTSWTEIKTGLDPDGVFGTCFFDQKMYIWNGLDTPMYYDGTNVVEIEEYVEDIGTNPLKIDGDTFTIETVTGRGVTDYPVGRTVRITMDGGTVITEQVLTSSYSSPTATINLETSVLSGTTINKVEFLRAVPAFSFMFPWNDRLWALSAGELKANNLRPGDDRLTAYYTPFTNNGQIWTDPDTMNLAFINMENKHVVNDEFLAIASYQNVLVFFGREATQLWAGANPLAGGDFSWQKTLPIGLLHPYLIQEIAGNLMFYTRGGIRSMLRVVQTEDLETSDDVGSPAKELAQRKIEELLQYDSRYKRARSFRYPKGNFVGFKLHDEAQIYFTTSENKGYVRFTGAFRDCDAFVGTPDDKLWLSEGGLLYQYGDNENRYSDNGAPITINWTTPWVQPKGGARWANRKVELELDPGDTTTVQLWRYKNNDDANYVITELVLPQQGSYWDEADWDLDYWDSVQEAKYTRAEDKFIAYNASYKITNTSTVGPIDFVSLNLFGKTER